MATPTIGLLIIDGITLADVTPICERLETLGIPVTVIVPTGGTILPISGRYYPAAGGHNNRRSLCQVSPADFALLIIPDGITGEQLSNYPQLIKLMRGAAGDGTPHPTPVFTVGFIQQLLDHGVNLDGLLRVQKELCTKSNSRAA